MAERVVVFIIAHSDGEPVNLWLEDYDNSEESKKGYGILKLTGDPTQARVFKDTMDAMSFWQQVSRTVPTRTDGRPNRPLTVFSVSVGPAPNVG